MKNMIKRIIIGIIIGLVLMACRKYLFINVKAETIAFTPNDIVIVTSQSNNTYGVTSNTWLNRTIYAFPENTPIDWPGTAAIYFRYSQFNGSNYCSQTSNNGSISGTIMNGNTNVSGSVRLEDRVNNSYISCSTSLDGVQAHFTCNNVNLSHALNIMITSANNGRYGITKYLEIDCTMTNEGLANVINQGNQAIIDSTTSAINNTTNAINNTTNAVNNNTNAINNMNNSIKDESAPDSKSDLFDGITTDDESNSPISDLILMPLTLMNAYVDGFSSTCNSFDLGSLYGHNIVLPCINIEDYLGSNLWGLIDIMFTLFLVYNIGLMCVSMYESITSLEDGFRGLYTPRHADSGYQPRHGGGD